MKTLKEMIQCQPITHKTDLEIICDWFVENNEEKAGLKILPMLAESQLNKVEEVLDYARSWIPNLIDMKNYYNKKTAKWLNLIQKCCILDIDLKSYSQCYDWAEKEIPNMLTPKIFFRPAIDYLAKYGIKFKDKEVEE